MWSPGTHSTNFDANENPISEGGRWSNNGQNWTFVQTANGIAYGTNGAADTYDDSYAYLSGFGANQQAEAVVYRSATLSGDPHEVELLLRARDVDIIVYPKPEALGRFAGHRARLRVWLQPPRCGGHRALERAVR